MKITKSQLTQIIKEELKNVLNEVKFKKIGYHRPGEHGPTGLGPVGPRGGPSPQSGEEISIWHDGNWHDTVLTDEELEAIQDAFDPDYERYTDVVERVLSSMRDLDIEDVQLSSPKL